MNIVDLQHFEERLRESEAKLGIRSDQGVPIVYERSGDTAGRLLASIIVVAIIVSLLSRNMNIKGPLSMEGMVSGQESVGLFTIVIVCNLSVLCFFIVILFFVVCLLFVFYYWYFMFYYLLWVVHCVLLLPFCLYDNLCCFVDLFIVWQSLLFYILFCSVNVFIV